MRVKRDEDFGEVCQEGSERFRSELMICAMERHSPCLNVITDMQVS